MNFRRLSADLTAGLTVSFAAISLGAAFGVMSGRGAFAGMMGAAILPIIASLFGGTRIQASGPTAPMTAITALVVAFAYEQFPDKVIAEQFITLVFLMNAVLLMVAGLVGLGRLIRLVPNVVILGFMNGIALLIWVDQFTKVFAIGPEASPMAGGIVLNASIAVITFGLIFGIIWGVKKVNLRPQLRSFISGVLWSIILVTAAVVVFDVSAEKVKLGATLESFVDFTGILINYFPSREILTMEYIWMAIPYALQLTLLAYLDSLLTALVVDRMTHERSLLNKELLAQGLANASSALLQGIPGAQATIRSVLLIKEGAATRLAGVMIGVFALLCILLFKDYLMLVPAAVFVGVLFKVGLDVADKDFLLRYFRLGWINSRKRNIQLLFIIYTTAVTVVVNLNVAVISGTVLFLLAHYLWKVEDVEADFNDAPAPPHEDEKDSSQSELEKIEKEDLVFTKK